LAVRTPVLGYVLLGEVSEGGCMVRVIEDKVLIEVCETKKSLYILDLLWNWLVLNYFYLVFIHLPFWA